MKPVPQFLVLCGFVHFRSWCTNTVAKNHPSLSPTGLNLNSVLIRIWPHSWGAPGARPLFTFFFSQKAFWAESIPTVIYMVEDTSRELRSGCSGLLTFCHGQRFSLQHLVLYWAFYLQHSDLWKMLRRHCLPSRFLAVWDNPVFGVIRNSAFKVWAVKYIILGLSYSDICLA